jgi:hypothetical protein
MPKRTVADMAHALYDDDALAQAVLADVERLKTADRIESGELVLPSKQDAAHWLARETGQQQQQSAHDALADEVAQLREQVRALQSKGVS